MKQKNLIMFFAVAAAILIIPGCNMKSKNKEGTDTIKIYNAERGCHETVTTIQKSDMEWKSLLSPESFDVTRNHGTERPFTGKLNFNKEKGIYQCVACGNDLFSSDHKFDSGTGWPSFFKPVAKENIGVKIDKSLFMDRIEVHCARCGAHLGHVFDDGPEPTGKRYCVNSVSLNFKKENK